MRSVREKVVSAARAAGLVREAQAAGEVVVMCHGCFDLVHPGHVRHLQQAGRFGDRLLVTVTGDAMMGKGGDRPLIPQELRAENLAALDCVSWVAVSDEPTAVELLRAIRPDVYVKGREYEHNRDPRFEEEKRVVAGAGGRVVFTSGDVVFSSTALIGSIEDRADPAHRALRLFVEQNDLRPEAIDAAIGRFRDRRVLVVGETIADTYVLCDQPLVAEDSPVMTLRPVESRRFDGGAAMVARHLAAMGARPVLVTPLPRAADALRLRLEVEGVEVHGFEVEQDPVEKQRLLVGTTKMMQLEIGEPLVLDEAARGRAVDLAADLARGCAAAIVADFGLGFLSAPMLDDLCGRVRPAVGVLAGAVSGRRSNLLAMRRADLLCPSEMAIRDALHDYEEGLSAVVWHLLNRTASRAALVTLGADGLIAFDDRGGGPAGAVEGADFSSRLRARHVPALARHFVDRLGCDDALLAAATLSLGSGGSLALAALLGSVAAAAASQKLGHSVIGAAELRRGVRRILAARLTYDPEPVASLVTRHHDQLSPANTEPA